MQLQFRANFVGRYIEMRMRRVHLTMHTERITSFSSPESRILLVRGRIVSSRDENLAGTTSRQPRGFHQILVMIMLTSALKRFCRLDCCVFKFLGGNVDGNHLLRFQSKTSIFKLLRCSEDSVNQTYAKQTSTPRGIIFIRINVFLTNFAAAEDLSTT